VHRADCGVVSEAGNPEALAAAIRSMSLSAREPADLAAMGQRGRAYALEYFDRSLVLERWDRLIADLAYQPVRRK